MDSAPYNAHYERPATLALLPDVNGKHVLDAGCGSGFYVEELMKRGARVTGIDASGEMLKHAERRLEAIGAHADLHVSDLSDPLDFLPDESLDGILAPLVLHYLKDWAPTLHEFLRVLKGGGWLVMSTHHPTTEAARFDIANYFAVELLEDYWSWVGTVHFYRRPLSAITGALTSAGFVIETLAEPLPDEIFRVEKPDAYQRILKHPDFLMIRAQKLG
ncbi:MAG TPA: class I SAM-dependent methyltransferase [Gemmatimonadaceae bacterium]|nr:class I SAM-dependent methyltransferase [Gemmatimonadaceae bacterium]